VLYRDLVLNRAIAVSIGAWYMSNALDATRFGIHGAPAEGVSLDALEAAIDEAIAVFVSQPFNENDLTRAKTRLVADMVYAQDSQAMLARVYGSALAIGEKPDDVQSWPERIEAVTGEDVIAAAKAVLDPNRAVTGFLLPA
jgi:zinc protease